ncbi:MAG TPA: YggS family pyridoxal phosphate-dependent enzyme [Micromonosporaceae bacterium]
MTGNENPASETAGDVRQAQLRANLALVRDRLAAACAAAGRRADEVTLVAVTKTHPAADVIRLASLGVTEIGENRDQEASPKAAEVAAAGVKVRWHFVGQLQRNKCRSVVRYADLVHSVDGVRLAEALARATRTGRGRPLEVLVQVSLDAAPGRGGAIDGAGVDRDDDLAAVLAAVAAAPELDLRGLMAVAPLDWEPERAYASLAELAARVRADYPSANLLSAGMSGDVEQAISYGATHVRIGNALLGVRPTLM